MEHVLPERRRSVRIESAVSVHYCDQERSVTSLSKDIGENGIRFTTNKFIPVFSRVLMDISLSSNSEPVRALAEVVWVSKLPHMDMYSIGSRFVGVSGQQKKAISEHMEREIAGV
ncbi:MAG: PilZ domain-containing protein [bacterium]